MTKQPTESSPRTVDCPPPPLGCAATAGEPCLSHGGTRVRHSFHQARTAAWEAARIAAVPAARLVADAVAERRIRHAQHAVTLLREHGHQTEADKLQSEVRARNGLMSAKQSATFLLDEAEKGAGS